MSYLMGESYFISGLKSSIEKMGAAFSLGDGWVRVGTLLSALILSVAIMHLFYFYANKLIIYS